MVEKHGDVDGGRKETRRLKSREEEEGEHEKWPGRVPQNTRWPEGEGAAEGRP